MFQKIKKLSFTEMVFQLLTVHVASTTLNHLSSHTQVVDNSVMTAYDEVHFRKLSQKSNYQLSKVEASNEKIKK